MFKNSYAIIKRNPELLVPYFFLLLALDAIIYQIPNIHNIQTLASSNTNKQMSMTQILQILFSSSFISLLTEAFAIAAIYYCIGLFLSIFYIVYALDSTKSAKDPAYVPAFDRARSNFLDQFLTRIALYGLIGIMLVIIFSVLVIGLIDGAGTNVSHTTIGIFLLITIILIVALFYLYVAIYPLAVVIVTEKKRFWEAVKRSMEVTKGRRLTIFIILVFVVVIGGLLNVITEVVNVLSYPLGIVASDLIRSFVLVLSIFVSALFYLDAIRDSKKQAKGKKK